jgi:hypothetical protein
MKTFAIVSLHKCCQHKPSSDLYLTTGTSDLANFTISPVQLEASTGSTKDKSNG